MQQRVNTDKTKLMIVSREEIDPVRLSPGERYPTRYPFQVFKSMTK